MSERPKSQLQQHAQDYLTVLTAVSDAPAGEERAAVEKTLRKIWERRRREKAAKAKEDKSKK